MALTNGIRKAPVAEARKGPRRGRAGAAAAAGLLAAGLAATVAGCAADRGRVRLEPTSYVYEGYHLGIERGVTAVVEDIRYAAELKGSIVVDLAFINGRTTPIDVDLGLAQVQVADREILAWEARNLRVEPGAIERATLSFRTDLEADELRRGVLTIPEVRLDNNEAVSFSAGFYVASGEEMDAEE